MIKWEFLLLCAMFHLSTYQTDDWVLVCFKFDDVSWNSCFSRPYNIKLYTHHFRSFGIYCYLPNTVETMLSTDVGLLC